jgi:hypothetical protein
MSSPEPYPWPPPPYPGNAAAPARPRNGLGTAALMLALAALVFCWTVLGGIALGLSAVVLGFAGRAKAARGEADNGVIASAGIALGALAVVVGIVFVPIWAGVFTDAGFGDYVGCMREAGTDRDAQVRCEHTFRDKVEQDFNITVGPRG